MLLYNILVEDEPFNWEPSACLYITYVAIQFVASNLAGRVGCHRLWESSVRYLQPCRVVTTLYNGCKEIVIVVKLYISKVYHGLSSSGCDHDQSLLSYQPHSSFDAGCITFK